MREQAVKTILELVDLFGYNIERIILFGSRARGDAKPDSDWDFLVIVVEDLTFRQKQDLIVQIQRRLAVLKIPNDIILKSKREYDLSREQVGTISYYASLEGVEV